MINDTLAKLAKQRSSISPDSVDKMIDNAKGMRPKPFQRDTVLPDSPDKAGNDNTRVTVRKPDNILPTMDSHGVEDIVRNLSRRKSGQR